MITIKLFHLFFLILWLGTLFLMPYLIQKRFEGAKKLYKWLELPSMILALLLGLILLLQNPAKMKIGLFHMKLTAALVLVGIDLFVGSRKTLSQRMRVILQVCVAVLLIAILFAVLMMRAA
jgi:uncharacterized membrane protein